MAPKETRNISFVDDQSEDKQPSVDEEGKLCDMFTFDNNYQKSRQQQAVERLPQHQMAETVTSKFLSEEAGLLVHQKSRPLTPSDQTGQIASEGAIPYRPKTNHAFGSAQPHVDIYTRSSLYAS